MLPEFARAQAAFRFSDMKSLALQTLALEAL